MYAFVYVIVVAWTIVLPRGYPHEGEKKVGPLGGVLSGRGDVVYPASEHAARW